MSMSAIAARAAALLLTSEKGRRGIGFLLVAIFAPVILIAAILCSTTSGGADHNNSAVEASFYGVTYSEDVPDEFRTHIAHRALLIYHVVYLQVRRYRQLILGLYHVEVTIHDTRNIRHIRNHTQHLVEIKLAHADSDILQCIFVLIVGINTHTHSARPSQH